MGLVQGVFKAILFASAGIAALEAGVGLASEGQGADDPICSGLLDSMRIAQVQKIAEVASRTRQPAKRMVEIMEIFDRSFSSGEREELSDHLAEIRQLEVKREERVKIGVNVSNLDDRIFAMERAQHQFIWSVLERAQRSFVSKTCFSDPEQRPERRISESAEVELTFCEADGKRSMILSLTVKKGHVKLRTCSEDTGYHSCLDFDVENRSVSNGYGSQLEFSGGKEWQASLENAGELARSGREVAAAAAVHRKIDATHPSEKEGNRGVSFYDHDPFGNGFAECRSLSQNYQKQNQLDFRAIADADAAQKIERTRETHGADRSSSHAARAAR